MSNIKMGADALTVLNDDGSSNEFTKFNSGTTLNVKVLGETDIMQVYAYGVFKRTHTFVAKEPSLKSNKGFPEDNLTPWDKAFLYHYNKSEKFQDDESQKAYQYKPKLRFAIGLYDLDAGEEIVIDVSRNQAQVIMGVINENRDRLDKLAFTVSKSGSSRSTVVSMNQLTNVENMIKMKEAGIETDSELSDVQLANFQEAPESFDPVNFEGLFFEADHDDMLANLHKVGFDVSIIGEELPELDEDGNVKREDTDGGDTSAGQDGDGDGDHPF